MHTISGPLLLFIRHRSSSLAALKYFGSNHPSTDSSLYRLENLPLQPHDGFKDKPRRLCSSNCPNSNIFKRNARRNFDRLGNGGIVNLERESRLKRYSEMLQDCALNWCLNEGKAIHGQIIKNGTDPDLHLWVSLINFYVKCGSLNSARQVLDEMSERDVVSWTSLIAGFVAEGYCSDGVNLFCEMQKEGIRPNEFTFATVLKACSMCLDLEFGKQIHTAVIKCKAFSDIYVGSALVELYAKCGEMEYADKVFFFMPEQNVVSWNVLLDGYAEIGDGEEVLKLFCRMKNLKMKFSKFTLSTVLKGFANSENLKAGQVVHSMAIKIGCELDEYISCSLVDMYSKCGLADDALKVFMMIKNPGIVAWSAMISCLDQQGQKQEAAKLFCLMRHTGLRPNQFTLASIVGTATDLGDLHYCESIHACVYKYGFESENLVSNALITMYMKIGSVHDGYRGFKKMFVEGFKPNVYTFISILRSCSGLSNIGFGKQVHACIIKDSLDGDGFIGTALIDMYAKCRCLEGAEVIFKRLNGRDLFTWTVMIAAYAQTDQGEEAFKCFIKMQREGVKPNEFTLSSCLSGCSSLETLENGRHLHSLAIKAGISGNMYVASALVDMYSKCRCIEDAEAVFNNMVERNIVSWNTIICGYSQHGKGEKALKAFHLMLDEGTVPDEVTFIGVLSACSHMGLIEEGKKHFDSLSRIYGITPTIEHHACMVNILCRAGKFHEVERFIEEMELTQNALIWETVIWASKMHVNVEFGQKAADKLFELEPKMDYNYISLSHIFATKGRWDDVAKVRALMSGRGIKKEPGCSWVEVDARAHTFFSQDGSDTKIKQICLQLGKLTR